MQVKHRGPTHGNAKLRFWDMQMQREPSAWREWSRTAVVGTYQYCTSVPKKNFTVPSCVNNFTILTSLKRWTSRVTTMQWQLWSSIQCLKSRVCKAEALPLFFNRKYWSRTQAFLTQVNWIVVHSYKLVKCECEFDLERIQRTSTG
jgi:hypothetical protein